MIKENIIKAIMDIENKEKIAIDEPCVFRMGLCDGFRFKKPETVSWKGTFSENEANWEATSVQMGLELFDYVRDCINAIKMRH
jgi:hypothetical protein